MSILSPKNMQLMRMLRSQAAYNNMCREWNAKRLTSTTSSSKGQAMSMPTTDDLSTSQPTKLPANLNFEDSQTAFKAKTTLDLLRGYVVFQLCSIRFLVDNQKTILDLSQRVFGKRLFNLMMRSTFYGHFVAGKDQQDIRQNVENMMKYGVKSILDYSAEEDLASAKEVKLIGGQSGYFHPAEAQSDKNKQIFLDCIDAVSDVTNATGIAAVKVTSLIRPALLLKLSSFVANVKKDGDLFKWKSLVSMNDADFAKLFNSKSQNEELKFDENELGELRNMFKRMDQIVEVNIHTKRNRNSLTSSFCSTPPKRMSVYSWMPSRPTSKMPFIGSLLN